MTIATCPRCREEFRVPTGAIPADAYAQCPWCHETFPVTEVLENLPPQLQILSADGTPLAVAAAGSGLELVESASRQRGELSSAARLHEASDSAFQLESSEQGAAIEESAWQPDFGNFQASHEDPYSTWDSSDPSPVQSMKVSRTNGRPKRKTSGLGTAIGIVLGGLASVPIAGGLLMLLGRTPDWGFWPFNGDEVAVRAAAPLPEPPRRSRTPSSSGTPLRFNLDQPEADASADPSESAAQEIMNASLSEADRDPAADSSSSSPGDTQGESALEAGESTATESSSIDGDADADARLVTSTAESDDAAIKAAKMIDAISQGDVDEAEQQRRVAMTYQTIAKAAGLAEGSTELLERLATKIADSPLANQIGSAGWESLDTENPTTDGIALIGQCQGPAQDDPQQATRLTAGSGQSVRLDSDVELPNDQPIVVLGRVVEQGAAVKVIQIQPLP